MFASLKSIWRLNVRVALEHIPDQLRARSTSEGGLIEICYARMRND